LPANATNATAPVEPQGRQTRRKPMGGVMNYVDGFVLPIPKAKLTAYRRIARKAGQVWREHGALSYVECVADDVKPGKLTSFPQAVKLKPDEVVVFSWIVYPSRAQRDRINKKVMADPRLAEMMNPKTMPFDGRRMFWGGFKTLIEL
jgi:uncharacterized protein YbaA (DUF1428 family)